jgi:hypothetical protein
MEQSNAVNKLKKRVRQLLESGGNIAGIPIGQAAQALNLKEEKLTTFVAASCSDFGEVREGWVCLKTPLLTQKAVKILSKMYKTKGIPLQESLALSDEFFSWTGVDLDEVAPLTSFKTTAALLLQVRQRCGVSVVCTEKSALALIC